MPIKRFLKSLRPQHSSTIPVPPETGNSPSQSQHSNRRPLRWIVVLVLGSVIAASRLYYPDILTEAIEFADGIWPEDGFLGLLPATDSIFTSETLIPANQLPANGNQSFLTPPPLPAGSPEPAATQEVEGIQSAQSEGSPGPRTLPGQTQADLSQAGALEVGTQMLGSAWESSVTMWSYPGDSDGHQVIHKYNTEITFEVVEPDRITGNYPVEFNGISWLRVQAEDGLVGWVKSSELEVSQGQASQ